MFRKARTLLIVSKVEDDYRLMKLDLANQIVSSIGEPDHAERDDVLYYLRNESAFARIEEEWRREEVRVPAAHVAWVHSGSHSAALVYMFVFCLLSSELHRT